MPGVLFQESFKTVKRPQKLNLTLSFKLSLRTKTFSAIKMKLFEVNSSRIEIIFQLETRELRKMVGNHFPTEHQKIYALYNHDSHIQWQTPKVRIQWQTPKVHLNSIFSARNGPREKPWKNPKCLSSKAGLFFCNFSCDFLVWKMWTRELSRSVEIENLALRMFVNYPLVHIRQKSH